ncbi:MAG: hypothetical protein ISS77_01880 [Phycisphaerae bacterium]|nr:hypothetical protein [Phycisphaerae bacterium]
MADKNMKTQIKKLHITAAVFAFLAMFCSNGCSFVKLFEVFASPTRHERKIPAEFNLSETEDKKVLVLVNQPDWLAAPANLRYDLTEAVNKSLELRVGILPENIISYDALSDFRSKRSDFLMLDSAQIGKALGADMVMFISLDTFAVEQVEDTGYYNGLIEGRAVLVDVAESEKLWPKSSDSKPVKVGYEIGYKGQANAIKALCSAFAHCVTRNLYDCREDAYKVAEDRGGSGWKRW